MLGLSCRKNGSGMWGSGPDTNSSLVMAGNTLEARQQYFSQLPGVGETTPALTAGGHSCRGSRGKGYSWL